MTDRTVARIAHIVLRHEHSLLFQTVNHGIVLMQMLYREVVVFRPLPLVLVFWRDITLGFDDLIFDSVNLRIDECYLLVDVLLSLLPLTLQGFFVAPRLLYLGLYTLEFKLGCLRGATVV